LNFNLLNWTAGSGSPPGYAVYRQISGTYTLIGVTGNANTYFADIGYTAFPFLDWVPSTPAGGALADALVTTITSGGGTTSLVLAGSATTAATSQGVYHDDGAAIFAALSSSTTFPAGTFYVASAAGGSIPANVNVNGQFGNTIIQSVFVGGKIFVENATKNRISNLTFNLVPGSSAISSTGGSGGSLDHLICNGGGTGNAGTPDCIVGIDMAATTISYVNLNGWVSVLSPEVTGGVPPSIILTGTAAGACVADFLDHISMGNEGQFMVEQPSVAFHYCSNSSITSSILAADLGGVSTVALGGVGIEWDGQSEVLSVIGNQLLGFNANLSLDTGTNGNPAQLTAIGNLFDFCADQCIAINAGGWFNITGNQFVGEDHAPWNYAGDAGVFTASGVTSGPNIVTANTFNGFNGAGSIAIHFTSAMNNTTESGNQFTLSTNVSGGTGGTNSAIGANCSGAPTGSFSVFNGAIGHC
jgi:hypothetical protein